MIHISLYFETYEKYLFQRYIYIYNIHINFCINTYNLIYINFYCRIIMSSEYKYNNISHISIGSLHIESQRHEEHLLYSGDGARTLLRCESTHRNILFHLYRARSFIIVQKVVNVRCYVYLKYLNFMPMSSHTLGVNVP